MTKPLVLIKYHLLFFIILILSVGCNNNQPPANEPATTDTDKMIPSVTQSKAASFSGLLDTLYISSDTFEKKIDKGAVVLVFTIQNNDVITMHGWSRKDILQGKFPTDPDIKLLNGTPSGLSYGPGTYFGNLVLDDIKKIKKLIKKNSANYVLFAPKKIDDHISYEIFLSKEDPKNLAPLFGRIPTNMDANPSPPKKY